MDVIELIIKAAAVVAAITALAAFLYKAFKWFDKAQKTIDYVAENIDKVQGIDDIKRHTHENYLTNLRLTIMSSEMPMGERIVAARKYIDEGGNGEVKKFCINELHVNDVVKE